MKDDAVTKNDINIESIEDEEMKPEANLNESF